MNDEPLAGREIAPRQDLRPTLSRRRLLALAGWGLLPAAIGLASCSAPQYDPDRGLWVMRPKK
jgi:hypothetical protein